MLPSTWLVAELGPRATLEDAIALVGTKDAKQAVSFRNVRQRIRRYEPMADTVDGRGVYRTRVFGIAAVRAQEEQHDPFELRARALWPFRWLAAFGAMA